MPSTQSEWYIGERVKALAVMHLTRRKDLVVKEEVREPGKIRDLLVEIISPEKVGWRRFGVYLQGTKAAVTEKHADRVLSLSLQRFRDYGETPYPFCLFYFTMDDNQGYFTWVAEPIISDGTPKLDYHEEAHCIKLDREALDHIVDRVNDWYDAFYGMVKL